MNGYLYGEEKPFLFPSMPPIEGAAVRERRARSGKKADGDHVSVRSSRSSAQRVFTTSSLTFERLSPALTGVSLERGPLVGGQLLARLLGPFARVVGTLAINPAEFSARVARAHLPTLGALVESIGSFITSRQ